MSEPQVGLVGFYGVGNYGDDLMASLCASHLVEHGFPCTVFSLGKPGRDSLTTPSFEHLAVRITHDPRELVRVADMLVWGGGGLLVSWDERTFRRRFPGIAEKFHCLVELSRLKGLPRCAVSVGGDGRSVSHLTPAYKELFMEGAYYASVRNSSDLTILQNLGVKGEVFPDLVWRAGSAASSSRPPGDRLRIGLDVYLANLADRCGLHFAALLQALVWRCPQHTFVCLNSNHRTARPSSPNRWLRLQGKNVEHYQFHDFSQDATMLGSLNLLVSSRLHVPVVCLGHRVPVVWTFCERKTQVFLHALGLKAMDFGHGRVLEFADLLVHGEKLEAFLANYPFPDTEALFHSSKAHLNRLIDFVRAIRCDVVRNPKKGFGV